MNAETTLYLIAGLFSIFALIIGIFAYIANKRLIVLYNGKKLNDPDVLNLIRNEPGKSDWILQVSLKAMRFLSTFTLIVTIALIVNVFYWK